MHKMNNLEYNFIARELDELLRGKHLGRIRKIGENTYRMKIGSLEVLAECGVRVNATKYIEASEVSDKFLDKVNKELDNAKLISVKQLNKDRLISFEFDRGNLVFEMFGEGNVILVRDGNTICASRYESWSDREIKAGSAYSPPSNIPSENLEVSDKYIIVSLMKLPLGKEYALESLSRLGIEEKKPGNSLSGNKIQDLENAIADIKKNAKPYAFYENGKLIDFALAKLKRFSSLEAREMPSLSEAADEYYAHFEKPNPKLEKLNERLSKQKERMAELEQEEKEFKQKGDYLYENYQKAEEILSLAKQGEFAELESKYGAVIDKKEKSVEVEL